MLLIAAPIRRVLIVAAKGRCKSPHPHQFEDSAMTAKPFCVGCHKYADEIEEYIEAGAADEMTPDEFVRELEGTFNPDNGHFLCTICYVQAGMPSSECGWIAP